MPIDITINNITGSSPYDIYICDDPVTTCIYVNTINSLPYQFEVPPIMSTNTIFNLKVVDNNGCTTYENLTL
jgi:hypothetical protein